MISIELKSPGSGQGPGYTTTIYPPAGRKPFHVDVSLADFEHDENSLGDAGARLDPARIKSIAFADITTLLGGAPGSNKIRIGPLDSLQY